jgi:4-amino-4-deoxy-L-arabinose transferase-like glycosyltransferase
MKQRVFHPFAAIAHPHRRAPNVTPIPIGAIAIALTLVIAYVAFLHNLGSISLVDETEPKFAEAARQMLVRGDWITPYFNTEPRFDKPPLVYWLMALGYQAIGVNEWAVRLPSALSAIALMGFLFYTLHHYAPDRSILSLRHRPLDRPDNKLTLNAYRWFAGFLGAAIFALNPHSLVWGRIGVSDMLLVGCMGSALLAFFHGYVLSETDRAHPGAKSPNFVRSQLWFLAFYILLALAVLTKGPVGIAIPAIVIAAFLLYIGRFGQVLREMGLGWGIFIVLELALPWFILVYRANGQAYLDSFFGYHNLERFAQVVNGHSAPWYFYVPIVFGCFVPWSVYLPIAIARVRVWQQSHWRLQPRSQQLALFALFWLAGVFLFFSIAATKLPSYMLPLIPAAAILVACHLSTDFFETSSEFATLNSISRWLNLILFLVLGVAFFTLPGWLGYDPAAPDLDEILPRSGLAIAAAAIWLIMAVWGEWQLLGQQGRWLWNVNLVGILAVLILAFHPMYLLLDRERQFPLRQLAALIPQVRLPGEDVVMVALSKTSLVFYSQQPIVFRARPDSAIEYIAKQAQIQPQVETVLIISPEGNIQRKLNLQDTQYRTLGQVRAYKLIRTTKQAVVEANP